MKEPPDIDPAVVMFQEARGCPRSNEWTEQKNKTLIRDAHPVEEQSEMEISQQLE